MRYIPLIALSLMVCATASAQTFPDPVGRKAPAAAPGPAWDGFYFGGHAGQGRGNTRATEWDPAPTSDCASRATSTPIAPAPTMPTVLPRTKSGSGRALAKKHF